MGLLDFHVTEHVYFALDLQSAFLLFITSCSLLPWLRCGACWTKNWNYVLFWEISIGQICFTTVAFRS